MAYKTTFMWVHLQVLPDPVNRSAAVLALYNDCADEDHKNDGVDDETDNISFAFHFFFKF